MKKITLFALLLFSFPALSQSVERPWNPAVTPITEAGNDYASSTLTSTPAHTLLTINLYPDDLNRNYHYTVYVRRTDTGPNWNAAGLQIWCRRFSTGAGGPSSSISGGQTFISVSTADAYFFEGENFRSGIAVYYQITGISVLVPAANYVTTITFTHAED